MSKRAHTAQGENRLASPAHHRPDGGTGLGHKPPGNWPAYGAHGHHLANGDFHAGIASQAEAFEGPGTAEGKAGEDPTGQSGGTLISNMIPSVM